MGNDFLYNNLYPNSPSEIVIHPQLFKFQISQLEIETQEAYAIESLMKNGTAFGRTIRQLIDEEIEGLDPSWGIKICCM